MTSDPRPAARWLLVRRFALLFLSPFGGVSAASAGSVFVSSRPSGDALPFLVKGNLLPSVCRLDYALACRIQTQVPARYDVLVVLDPVFAIHPHELAAKLRRDFRFEWFPVRC